jgi:dienelactone hydrolase
MARPSALLLAVLAVCLAAHQGAYAGTSVPLAEGAKPLVNDDAGEVVISRPSASAAADAAAPAATTKAAAPATPATTTPTPATLLGSPQHSGSYKLVGAAEGPGKTVTLGGLQAYLAEPAAAKGANTTAASTKPTPQAAVLLYSDIYGWRGNGTRQWADRLAALGYVAVVPDFFQGRSGGSSGRVGAAAQAQAVADRAFIISIPRENVTRDAAAVMRDLRALYPSVRRTAAYGFCWGGRYATLAVGGSAGAGAAADAAVSYHGSLIAPDEFAGISRPILFVNAADDMLFNSTAIAQAEKARDRNARRSPPVVVRLKEYEGVRHGFAVRAQPNDTVAAAAAESAFQDGVGFLRRQGVAP